MFIEWKCQCPMGTILKIFCQSSQNVSHYFSCLATKSETRAAVYFILLLQNPDSIVTKAKAKLNELCHSSWSTPKVQNVSLLNGTSSESTGKRQRTADSLMQNMEVRTCTNSLMIIMINRLSYDWALFC